VEFDAIVLAESGSAQSEVLGLTLAERARRVASRVGARRIIVIADAAGRTGLPVWDAARGDAALLVLRASDQLVHLPLVRGLIEAVSGPGAQASGSERKIAVAADGTYSGALIVLAAAASEVVAALARGDTDRAIVDRWSDVERVPHGDIARHPATTDEERAGAKRMLLRILVKDAEDSPVSKYIYRPLSRPLTVALLPTPITPNQVSYFVGFLGLLGCYFTARPGQGSLILGAALVFISGILDGCDGELSRLRLTSSAFGAWLDTVIDEITTWTYFVCIGYHTYWHHPDPWLAASVVFAAACYLASIYGIYYFCIVVLKAGGSQYYIGTLDIVEGAAGVVLRPRVRPPRRTPPWVQTAGTWAMYVIRRDFINMAALGLALLDAYEVIYAGMAVGGVAAGLIVIRDHVRLRLQLRDVARRGSTPRLVMS
jgi:phosphatidylglycerophosphate synthase